MRFMNDPTLDAGLEAGDYSDSDPSAIIHLTVPTALAGGRLDAVLAKLMPEYSRSRLAKWIEAGRVTLDGAAASVKTRLSGGETIAVDAEAAPDAQTFAPEPIALEVVHADAAIIVLDKPPGLVVHPAAGNWSGTLMNGLLWHFPELAAIPRAGIVHRLDKDTSGLMVVARTLAAQTELVRQLQARTVSRHYLAVVQGQPVESGMVNAPIGRHPRDRLRMAVVDAGKPAVTHYTVLERFEHHALVQCRLETGRTHQIRVHMAHIGHPLAADPVYGGRPGRWPTAVNAAIAQLGRQALHATRLALVHPEQGETVEWSRPPPADFMALCAALRENGVERT
jgi:23S rRNA pseudouridine1911/1915/1917 synthase